MVRFLLGHGGSRPCPCRLVLEQIPETGQCPVCNWYHGGATTIPPVSGAQQHCRRIVAFSRFVPYVATRELHEEPPTWPQPRSSAPGSTTTRRSAQARLWQ